MIRDACIRIGLPAPREVIITQVSVHVGVPLLSEVPPPQAQRRQRPPPQPRDSRLRQARARAGVDRVRKVSRVCGVLSYE